MKKEIEFRRILNRISRQYEYDVYINCVYCGTISQPRKKMWRTEYYFNNSDNGIIESMTLHDAKQIFFIHLGD